jgi:hypothetical protein
LPLRRGVGIVEAAWRVFLSNRTEADFQAWRRQRDWTAEKYRRFDRAERMPHDWRLRTFMLRHVVAHSCGVGV